MCCEKFSRTSALHHLLTVVMLPQCSHADLLLRSDLGLGSHRSKRRRLPLVATPCLHLANCTHCLRAALLQAAPAKKVESEEESSDEESSDEEEVRAAVTTPSRASCCCVLLVGGPVLLAGDSA